MAIFKKLFVSTNWNVAFREKEKSFLSMYDKPFTSLPKDKDYWFADPFLFALNGKNYLFCEGFHRKKRIGVLGYFAYDGKKWGTFNKVIENGYHMSYPCVFSYNDRIFMVPETSENGTLELYEAKGFPDKWDRVAILLDNVDYVDATVFCVGVDWFLYAYSERTREAHLFKLNLLNYSLQKVTDYSFSLNTGRCGGHFVKHNERLYRLSQNSVEEYGKTLILNQVAIHGSDYSEKAIDIIDVSRIVIDNKSDAVKMHTYNSNDDFEVIDYCYSRFDLFKRFKIFLRKHMKNKRRREKNGQAIQEHY